MPRDRLDLIRDAREREAAAAAASKLKTTEGERDCWKHKYKMLVRACWVVSIVVLVHLTFVLPPLRAIAAGAFGAAAIALRDAGSGWSSHHRGGW